MNYLSLGYSCSCHIIVYKLEAGSSNHAGSEPEAFWLRPVMDITASVQPESGRIVYNYAGSDFTASDWVPFFQRRPRSYCVKPARIRSGWPGHVSGQTYPVRKQAGEQESSSPVCGRM